MSSTSELKRCPKCGGLIPAEAAQGLCPTCLLMQAALPTETGKIPDVKSVPPTREALAAAFPQLEILELIGQGGMGFVFKARQLKLDRLVALKILPQSLASDPAFAERFSREGRMLARLNHPNIVTVHDFGLAGGFFYLLMEFVDGVNLRQAMKAGRFTPAQALAIVPKICEALQFAHDEGVLHRDIKPENILLDAKGRVKIADFGIAKLTGELHTDASLTGTGATLGTPNYMAPEQIENSGEVDHRADIYSLGVVFYEMLTGGLPIGHFAPPSEKSHADPRLDEVVLRALEKDRERRTQSADEVKTQVETITGAAGTPPPPKKQSVPTEVQAKPDRFWRWIAVIVLALIVIPIGIAMTGLFASILIPALVKARERARAQGEQPAAPTGFENAAAGDYTTGTVADGWRVTRNEAAVVTDLKIADGGSNFLALAGGQISKAFITHPGEMYQLKYRVRGPGLTDWWPGEGGASDLVGGNNGRIFEDNGNSDYVKCPASPTLGSLSNGGMTIECWINPSDVTDEHPLIEWNDGLNTASSIGAHLAVSVAAPFAIVPGCLYANLVDVQNNYHYLASAPDLVGPNAFQHVAVTYDKASGTGNIYYNGTLAATTNLGIFTPQTGYDLYIGKRPDARNFTGQIDDVCLYNRPLSHAEIAAIFHAGNHGKYTGSTPRSAAQASARDAAYYQFIRGKLASLRARQQELLVTYTAEATEVKAVQAGIDSCITLQKNLEQKYPGLNGRSVAKPAPPIDAGPNFRIAIDGVVTNAVTLTNTAGPWRLFTVDFAARESATTVAFDGNARGVLLDDIQLVQQPGDEHGK